jgi:hypothetical protein
MAHVVLPLHNLSGAMAIEDEDALTYPTHGLAKKAMHGRHCVFTMPSKVVHESQRDWFEGQVPANHLRMARVTIMCRAHHNSLQGQTRDRLCS